MDWQANERYRSRLKKFTKLYARMKLNGGIDYRKLCNVYGDYKEQLPEVKVKRLLRSETVQDMVESEILALYELENITAKSVISEENVIFKQAKESKDNNNAIKILQTWGKRIGLDPQQVKQSITLTAKTDYRALLEGTQSSTEPPKQLSDSNTSTNEEVNDD